MYLSTILPAARRVRKKGSTNEYNWTTSFHFVKKIKVHPRFDYFVKVRSWDVDIAIIEIHHRAPYYIKPMRVANHDDRLRNCETAGKWYFVHENALSGYRSLILAR